MIATVTSKDGWVLRSVPTAVPVSATFTPIAANPALKFIVTAADTSTQKKLTEIGACFDDAKQAISLVVTL
jgi:hypothetical protein